MASNNQKFNIFGIVINAPKEKATHEQASDFFRAILTALKDYNKIKFFASAIHDQDTHEDGTPKVIHLHIEIETFEKYTNLTFLKDFCNTLGVDKGLVSLNGSNNLFLLVQYLRHKNDPKKHQYEDSAIITSNRELYENLYNADYESKADILKRALKTSQTLDDFIEVLGVEDANKYRNLFKDLKIEQGADLKGIIEKLGLTRREYESLYNFTNDLLMTLKMGLKNNEKRIINLDRYETVFINTFLEPK